MKRCLVKVSDKHVAQLEVLATLTRVLKHTPFKGGCMLMNCIANLGKEAGNMHGLGLSRSVA